MGETKQCIKCGIIKGIDDFPNLRRYRDGKDTQCRLCLSNYRKNWYRNIKENDPEYYSKLREIYKKNYQINPKHITEKMQEERICKILADHHEELSDDPDRLTTEFMLSLLK
jgi:hypothetical protein